MKYYLAFLTIFYNIVLSFGKTIEDPVARHDAKQCGTYLCSGLPTLATQYIQSGCVGQFSNYILKSITTDENLNLLVETSNQIKTNQENNVNFIGLGFLATLCFISSTFIGYKYSKIDKVFMIKNNFFDKEY